MKDPSSEPKPDTQPKLSEADKEYAIVSARFEPGPRRERALKALHDARLNRN